MQGGESIFDMIKLAGISATDATKFALIRGLIIKGDLDEFKIGLQNQKIKMDEENFLIILEDLCVNDKHFWLPEVCMFSVLNAVLVIKFSAFKYNKNKRIFKAFFCKRANVKYTIN